MNIFVYGWGEKREKVEWCGKSSDTKTIILGYMYAYSGLCQNVVDISQLTSLILFLSSPTPLPCSHYEKSCIQE